MTPEQSAQVIQIGKDVIVLIGVLSGIIVSCVFWLLMKGVRK